jgi:sporulation protein YlmC with PRC-barrel domain
VPLQYKRLFGMDVYESDGSKIGSTGEVYLDRQTGDPEWISVKTGLFGTKETLVPLEGATVSDDRIVVPFGKDQVKNAPRIEPDSSDLTDAQWEIIEPMLPLPKWMGRPEKHPRRAIVDAILYGSCFPATAGRSSWLPRPRSCGGTASWSAAAGPTPPTAGVNAV